MTELDGGPLTLERLERLASAPGELRLSDDARSRMRASRATVERIVETGAVVYGVSTGFGKLSDVTVPRDSLARLQLNLVRSHSCGVGDPLSAEETRAMLLLRANVLAVGLSGARPELAEALLALLAADVLPVVPSRGSVGASGDLAPLAHVALTLIGEGEAWWRGARVPSAVALAEAGLQPVALEVKEGLALLNGTQAMVAIGGLALARAARLARTADVVGAMTLEALLGTPAAFDPRIHAARPHPGQSEVASNLRRLLEGSDIRESHREGDPRVQDAYSLRCMPQVHGAVRDAFGYARGKLEAETGSATDNPLVFAETGEVVSGGNFHGAPIAAALDFAAIALADLASISERRTERLVNPDLSEGLPPFLTRQAGTSSGFMIAQVAAAALLAEARILAHPASVDSVPTSAGKEDHVSMGTTSALKLRDSVGLVERVLAIEALAAAEGLDARLPLQPGTTLREAHRRIRSLAAPVTEDRPLSGDIERLAGALRSGLLDL
jgi:histidine ammonia-lyase